MAENDPTPRIRGYVSAYLKQSLRTVAEVERELQSHDASIPIARTAQGIQSNEPPYRGVERRAVKRH